MMIAEVRVDSFPSVKLLTEKAAKIVESAAREAVETRGRFLLALSGGNSPRPLYQLLSQPPYSDRIPWENTIIFWSDERFVPLDDDRSNAGMAMELLLNHVPVPTRQIFPMHFEDLDAEEAADQYESIISNIFGNEGPHLDLVLLGCGTDGHTASLFPGNKVLREKRALIRAVHPEQSDIPRITMTPPLLNQARQILFIAYGREKAQAVSSILQGRSNPDKYPAQLIAPTQGQALWLLDNAAASRLNA